MSYETKTLTTGKPLAMKPGRSVIHRQTYVLPILRFEDQQLTSFSGLVIFQRLFEHLRLKNRVRDCFRHLRVRPIFGQASIVILLIIHRLLRFRQLRHLQYYRHDPLVGRLLGLKSSNLGLRAFYRPFWMLRLRAA